MCFIFLNTTFREKVLDKLKTLYEVSVNRRKGNKKN